jgi:uncharacterized protein (DUF1499 family)
VKYLTSIILLLAVLVCLLVLGIFLHNRAQLFAAPGIAERIRVYLTQNSVQTSVQHRFPELRSAHFQVTGKTLLRAVQSTLVELGWSQSSASEDPKAGQYRVHAVVTTPVFKFQDDVMILIHDSICDNGSSSTMLDVRSASRTGRGDLAANAGHVQRLYEQVRLELGRMQSEPSACQ